MKNRTIERIERANYQPGFLGSGHIHADLIRPEEFSVADPFLMLADDLANGDASGGGPHPHAGFETVTLILEGELKYHAKSGEGALKAGDLQWMTAGKGVVHAETISEAAKFRALQLWLTLPKKDRWVEPAVQNILLETVPTFKQANSTIKLYSGSLGEMKSDTRNHVPVVYADIKVEPKDSLSLEIENSFNGFLYVIEGSINVSGQVIDSEEIAWLNRSDAKGLSELKITAQDAARVILVAGEVQHDPIVHHGPFVGDTQEDIIRDYANFRAGKLGHIHELM